MSAIAQPTATSPWNRLPRVAFVADNVQFEPETSPGNYHGEGTTMRVMIVELAHAEWGIIGSAVDRTPSPGFSMMIDNTFWFSANEIVGTLQLARQSVLPNGDWIICQLRFATAFDFADCARAVAEAKSHVLYHRGRMVDALVNMFERQVNEGLADESADEPSVPLPEHGAVDVATAAGTTVVVGAAAVVSAADTAAACAVDPTVGAAVDPTVVGAADPAFVGAADPAAAAAVDPAVVGAADPATAAAAVGAAVDHIVGAAVDHTVIGSADPAVVGAGVY
ncbi:hypothetical protein GSI_12597 [Ganoderma sinense ZZ0214-1]|uniref:Uncharacterized protein n=1 Tax=Ganoderma sinense ZZ0214-1 TaxID=1077348 RepID=A0A2G8RT80_9APHY|nr:hypothetical protein GSI_12597 [Ganoderma sinense ZZ0214-1]